MLDVLIDQKEPICDGESGLSSIKIINAAYLSSKSERRFYKMMLLDYFFKLFLENSSRYISIDIQKCLKKYFFKKPSLNY